MGSSSAQRPVYPLRVFFFSVSGVRVSDKDGKPLVDYDFHLSLQSRVEKFDVTCFNKGLEIFELVTIWIIGFCVKMSREWCCFLKECTIGSL